MGLIPSHRELSDLGGYLVLEEPLGASAQEIVEPEAAVDSSAIDTGALFGGPVRTRH